jgi:drug/metabolite transporter (DMT)-like permease
VCLIWGTTYLGIRVTLETIPPFLMSAFRWIVAGTLIAGTLRLRGERLLATSSWGSLAILGVLLLGVGNGAVVWAERTVPSGLTAVLTATSPFWMVGVDAMMEGGEAVGLRRTLGLIIGFSGIVLLVWADLDIGQSGTAFLIGVLSTQIAALGWAVGSAYARRRRAEENVLAAAAFEMLFGGTALLCVALVRQEYRVVALSLRSVSALAYLTVIGSIGGFSAYRYALKHLPVATMSLYAYVNPVIAVVLGTLVLSEPFTWRIAAAAGIVLAGMALVRYEATPPGQALDNAPAADKAERP